LASENKEQNLLMKHLIKKFVYWLKFSNSRRIYIYCLNSGS